MTGTPVFTQVPNIGTPVPVTAGNTRSDGGGTIGTDIFKALTAGAAGTFVSRVRWNPVATAAAVTTTGTVGRVFLSSVTSGATTGGTNTWLWAEVALASVSASGTTNPTNPVEVLFNIAIPAGYTILVTNHVAPAANTSWQAIVLGGDY